ncbi:MAG: protocatechuate 3,4-dioxygenase subunit alpha [Marinosulfonomonas sp.]|nr:protocatechuate 3,4-dioxygenase subunit alpha [Marinosulfonomonas sp.]
MTQKLELLRETPSQTAGPYVHIGCIPFFTGIETIYPEDLGRRAIEAGAKGQKITIQGAVYDGTGWRMRDAMMESWQPDGAGLFPGQDGADPKVNGFCRFAADNETGEFTLNTVKPGAITTNDGKAQAPHIALWVVARGINIGLQTRIYFEDEDNTNDPLLNRIEQRDRVQTLIAKKTGEGEYRFDIRLQGDGETVFLDM